LLSSSGASGGKTSAGWNSSPRIVFAKVRADAVADGLTGPGSDPCGYGLFAFGATFRRANFPPSADVTGRTAIGPGD